MRLPTHVPVLAHLDHFNPTQKFHSHLPFLRCRGLPTPNRLLIGGSRKISALVGRLSSPLTPNRLLTTLYYRYPCRKLPRLILSSTAPMLLRASTGSARTVFRPAHLPNPFALSVSK